MKRIFLTLIIMTFAQGAMSDEVIMATSEDLAAFNNLVKMDRSKREGSLKKEAVPQGSFGTLLKDEATNLRNEGSQGRESKGGKWVVEQRKSGKTADSDSKTGQAARENGKSKGKNK